MKLQEWASLNTAFFYFMPCDETETCEAPVI